MQELIDKIERREARCGVIGLGYVGLPLALEFAQAGFRVTGIDLDERKVRRDRSRARSYIVDVSDEEIAAAGAGRAASRATSDFSVIRDLDTINICVPTPLRKTKDPDLTYVVSAVNEIKTSTCVAGSSSSSRARRIPGTTEEVVRPVLEAAGLEAGQDFALAFSPERIDPGNQAFQHAQHPEGRRRRHARPARRSRSALYEQSVDTVVPVSSTQVAEMVKLLENTFRSVNIGLVNEIALMCSALNINVWEVIDAAKTKPFGFMAVLPGPGPRRALHPDRSVLPVVEGEDERLRRRASSSSPAPSTRACRASSSSASPTRSTGIARACAARASTCSASPTRRA